MNLHSLRYFYQATQFKTLTEASLNLHISQPALTRHIKNIEKEYKVQLVKKVGRQITLTKVGSQLVKECELLFKQEEKIEQLLTNQSKKSILKIGATNFISNFLLENLIQESLPNNLVLDIQTKNFSQLQILLEENLLDICFLPTNKTYQNYSCQTVFLDELIFVAHPNYCPDTITLNEIEQYSLIKREDGSYIQSIINNNLPFSPICKLQVNSHNDALIATQNSSGLYLSSKLSAKHLISEGKLKEVQIDNFPNITRNISIYLKKEPYQNVMEQMAKVLIKQFNDLIQN